MGWDEYNDEYLIEFSENELEEHNKTIRNETIEECLDELRDEHEIWINRGCVEYAYGIQLCIEDLKDLKNSED